LICRAAGAGLQFDERTVGRSHLRKGVLGMRRGA
jgi:hypothetical protein